VEALGGSALAGLFLVQDELPDEKTYATYTRTNAATGEVYVGRTSGYGTAEDLIKKRATSHPDRLKDFGPPVLDQSATGRDAYAAIRGREQQLIDANGGIGSPHVANRIRAVAKLNPGGPNFHLQSNNRFGEIAPYTGSMGFMFKFLP
jgi:hypothetical protein